MKKILDHCVLKAHKQVPELVLEDNSGASERHHLHQQAWRHTRRFKGCVVMEVPGRV